MSLRESMSNESTRVHSPYYQPLHSPDSLCLTCHDLTLNLCHNFDITSYQVFILSHKGWELSLSVSHLLLKDRTKKRQKWTRQQIMGEDFSSQLIFILGGLLSFINISPLAMWPSMGELLLWLSTHSLLLILSMRGARVGSGGIAIYHDFRNVTLLLVVDRKDDDGDSGRRMSRY